MKLPLPIVIAACVSWAVSAGLVWSLWKSKESVWFKIVGTLTAAIPLFGPLLYAFVQMPPKIPVHLRATMNHRGRGGRFIGGGSKQFNYDSVFDQTESKIESISTGSHRRSQERLTGWQKVGLVVACIFLAIYWTQAINYLEAGNAWGHGNYWGQPVGTFLLIAVLAVASVAFLVVLWRLLFSRYFEPSPTSRSNRTRRKRRAV